MTEKQMLDKSEVWYEQIYKIIVALRKEDNLVKRYTLSSNLTNILSELVLIEIDDYMIMTGKKS
ncbi:MAG: hypothetical protein WC679_13730 [Bacteroidales bacterium]|jgi:hypothetical protein